jgi:hypothetical protein
VLRVSSERETDTGTCVCVEVLVSECTEGAGVKVFVWEIGIPLSQTLRHRSETWYHALPTNNTDEKKAGRSYTPSPPREAPPPEGTIDTLLAEVAAGPHTGR